MQLVMNDISFRYRFENKELAMSAVREWLEVYRDLKSDRVKNVTGILTGNIDRDFETAPDYKWIQLLQDFKDKEDQRLLLTVLQASDALNDEENDIVPFALLKESSVLCAYAYKTGGICISLKSWNECRKKLLEGRIGKNDVQIKNIAERQHIDKEYAAELGIRIYEPNPKHSMSAYMRKGVEVSVMDLPDDEAQAVLNMAVELNGCYYARYNGKYYQFPNTRINIYHGFRNDKIAEDIKRKIDRVFT